MARWTRSWVTLAAIFLLGTGLAWTAVQTFRDEIQQRATQDAVVTSRTVLSLVITRHLDASSLTNGLSPAQVAELHRDVTVLQQDQKVVGLELWRADGTLLFADRAHPTVESSLPAHELDRSRREPAFVLVNKDGDGRGIDTFEIFLTADADRDGRTDAILEVILSEEQVAQVIESASLRLYGATAALLLLLATGLVWIRHRLAVREHELRQDQLTGLGNRTFLGEQEARLRSLQRDHYAALLLLDLNDFKEVNDRLGHRVGDDLLFAVATRLRNALRPQDTLVRLGGDEFVVLLTDLPYPAVAKSVAGHLLDSLRAPLTVGGIDLEVGASVGIAAYPRDGENLDTLLQHAEIAMYEAKRSGIATVTYEPAQDEHDVRQLALLAQLRRALASEELVLDYQPKLDLRSGTIVGFEALVRWNHPEHGLLSPDRFVPMAERTALIKPLTEWVLCTAVKQCAAWRRAGHDITVAVNVSPRNLLDPNLLTGVLSALQAGDLPAEALELEITETAVMTDSEAACGMLLQLRALGVRVSVDDFGAGYTSLSLLRSLPVHTLKIDRAFVTSMLDDPSCEAVVRCVIQLAKDLELSIIAEGVETPEVSQRLAALGCDEIQGWAVSRPMRPALVEGWLTEWIHSDRSATLSAGTDRRRTTFPGVGYSGL